MAAALSRALKLPGKMRYNLLQTVPLSKEEIRLYLNVLWVLTELLLN